MSNVHRGEERRISNFEGRMARLETTVVNQGQMVQDFIQETKKNTDTLFNAMDRMVKEVGDSKSTNWNQVGVMLSLAGMVGAFLFVAFIQPLKDRQEAMIKAMEKQSDIIGFVERDLTDQIHELEVEALKQQIRDKDPRGPGRWKDDKTPH